MKKYLVLSVLANLLLLGAIFLIINRLHGWRYAWFRLTEIEDGLYFNRRELFEKLPAHPSGGIFLVGDSQIEQCEWRELLGDSLPVYNRGISCDHIGGVGLRLAEIFKSKPSKILLCVGVNDLMFDRTPQDIERMYRSLLQKVKDEQPQCQILVNALLPINSLMNNNLPKNEEIYATNQRLEKLAAEFSAGFVHPSPLLVDTFGNLDQRYTFDGLHLNGAGYLIWRDVLLPFLQ